MLSPSRRLGEFLVDRKVLSRDTLETMLDREEREGTPLPRLLAGNGLVSEKDLMAAVAHQVGIPFLDLSETTVDPTLDRLVPADLARSKLAVAQGMMTLRQAGLIQAVNGLTSIEEVFRVVA